jgi:hypothetical protein
MIIKTKISFPQYRNLLFGIMYKKPMMKLILGVALAMLVWILGYYLHILPLPKPEIYQFITLFLIVVVQPSIIFWTIRRNYYSSNHLREPLEIEITKTEINMQGRSFFTKIAWKNIFKVQEQTNWYLVYQNNLSAIIIPKTAFHKDQEEEFRNILEHLPKIPVHLKIHNGSD